MRKHLRKYLPDHETIRGNRWLAPFHDTLLHPRLWHLNRRSAAGAVAAGLFCGLIPGPFQALGAAIIAVLFRVNLPLSMIITLYTNPLTIVPIYIAAFELGKLALGGGPKFTAPPGYGSEGLSAWLQAMLEWTFDLGTPLAIGLPLLAGALALAGYFVVRVAWRCYLVHHWQTRRGRFAP